jgi:magnesium-transporting ATPase (P-type)
MSLSKKVKVGLDETRILILGSQILLGFQFQVAFRPAFETLPLHDRLVWVGALGLITLAVAFLVTPSVQHRVVEGGHDTKRLLGVIGRYAGLSLAPFASALGADLFLATEPVLGLLTGAASGSIICGLALLFWYGLEAVKARTVGEKERAMTHQEPEHEHTSLETKVEQMLTEARVILPGAQALLGFQVVITFSDAFEKLPFASKVVHSIALAFITLTVIWLMAPAAFHRIVYAGG